ncbi:MAG: AAA family ATPase [Dehalococcoidia bacterium]|nr:AAA family ATPase [Dehalococcoidia bacterium]
MLVVQMHGEPGSGKSTLARALAPRIGAIVLDKDVIKAALLRSGIDEGAAAAGAYQAYFSLGRALVEQGHALVLDNPVFWPRVEARWLALSALAGSSPLLIECVCSDRDELRRRLRSRDALASQPREPLDLLAHPGAAATSFEPRLRLDTTGALDDLADEAAAYIERARSRRARAVLAAPAGGAP